VTGRGKKEKWFKRDVEIKTETDRREKRERMVRRE
jgi:hypothetical protein